LILGQKSCFSVTFHNRTDTLFTRFQTHLAAIRLFNLHPEK
jgi:hypothetical protein